MMSTWIYCLWVHFCNNIICLRGTPNSGHNNLLECHPGSQTRYQVSCTWFQVHALRHPKSALKDSKHNETKRKGINGLPRNIRMDSRQSPYHVQFVQRSFHLVQNRGSQNRGSCYVVYVFRGRGRGVIQSLRGCLSKAEQRWPAYLIVGKPRTPCFSQRSLPGRRSKGSVLTWNRCSS